MKAWMSTNLGKIPPQIDQAHLTYSNIDLILGFCLFSESMMPGLRRNSLFGRKNQNKLLMKEGRQKEETEKVNSTRGLQWK